MKQFLLRGFLFIVIFVSPAAKRCDVQVSAVIRRTDSKAPHNEINSGIDGTSEGYKRKSHKLLFTFVQINDSHVKDSSYSKNVNTYFRANDKLRRLVHEINTEKYFEKPAFVILPGDIIHGENYESLLPDCLLARSILDKLDCPYYPIIGNHEVIQKENDSHYLGPYESVFGKDRVNYFFFQNGLLFICMNDAGGDGNNTERNKWLRNVMEMYPGASKIIAAHIPLLPLRDESVLKESFGFSSYKLAGDETLNIVREHASSIIAVISGHLHLTGMVFDSGICHIISSGPGSFPCNYIYYSVFDDHIDVKTFQMDKDMVEGSVSLHGIPRYNIDYTDNFHSTGLLYISGSEAERKFTINMPPSKRIKQAEF